MRSDRAAALESTYSKNNREALLQEFNKGYKTIQDTGFHYAIEHFVKQKKGRHGKDVKTLSSL
jgi:hypothetical protein